MLNSTITFYSFRQDVALVIQKKYLNSDSESLIPQVHGLLKVFRYGY